ncbi:MAG: hypothetical protein J6W75_03255 [Bacteroidaceae bacterium]|nr:hypothetical protein [Bacteroidaceae bacterium]
MKKIYQKPALTIAHIEQSLPIATSLIINNEAQNGVSGDVNAAGNWGDIWSNDAE